MKNNKEGWTTELVVTEKDWYWFLRNEITPPKVRSMTKK